MRKIVVLAAVAIVVMACNNSEAANRRVRSGGSGTAMSNGPAQGSGPFSRLMEIERRKNAALRQMFTR